MSTQPVEPPHPPPNPNGPPGPPVQNPVPAITTASPGAPTATQHAQAAIFVVLGAAIGSLMGNAAITGWLAAHEFVAAFVQAAVTGMGVYVAYYVPKPPSNVTE
jgi:hypothetical protein